MPDPPKFAARFLEQFSQKGLASFFVKKEKVVEQLLPITAPAGGPVRVAEAEAVAEAVTEAEEEGVDEIVVIQPPPATAPAGPAAPSLPKPKPVKTASPISAKPGPATKPAQRAISSFFPKPSPKTANSQPPAKRKKSGSSSQPGTTSAGPIVGTSQVLEPIELGSSPPADELSETNNGDAAHCDPLDGLNAEELQDMLEKASAAAAATTSAWTGMFKPKPVPRCMGHGEPAKMWTVNKPGINKGRKFYLCSR